MDQQIKQQIVIAAAQLAGAGASTNTVMAEAKRIVALAAPGSAIMNALDYEVEKAQESPVARPFVGTVLHVDLETSNTRGVLFLGTNNGIEALRTDFTRGDAEAQQVVKDLRTLVGHKLLVTKRNEKWKNDPSRSTRLLVTFEDQGVDEAAVAVEGFGMDWAAWDADKANSPHSDKLTLASKGTVLPVQR